MTGDKSRIQFAVYYPADIDNAYIRINCQPSIDFFTFKPINQPLKNNISTIYNVDLEVKKKATKDNYLCHACLSRYGEDACLDEVFAGDMVLHIN